jgi:hypothetical protein
MRRITTISLAALMTLSSLGFFACSKKVDCEKVCKRTFDTCLEDVMVATGKVSKEQVELIKKMGKLKEAGKQGYDQCMTKCKDQKGMASDGDKINECMKKKSCEDFAKCMKSVIDA